MATQQITTITELINEHERKNPHSKFFSKNTLKFFGERISEMYLMKDTVTVKTLSGDIHTCYMVSAKQHKAPGGPKKVYHYFDVNTLAHVIKD